MKDGIFVGIICTILGSIIAKAFMDYKKNVSRKTKEDLLHSELEKFFTYMESLGYTREQTQGYLDGWLTGSEQENLDTLIKGNKVLDKVYHDRRGRTKTTKY